LFKVVGAGRHIPANTVHLVGTFLTIVGHHNCAIEITVNVGLVFKAIKALVNNC
jgi:hypothetical protein